MLKFFVWLVICALIHPVLAMFYVGCEILYLVYLIVKDDRERDSYCERNLR